MFLLANVSVIMPVTETRNSDTQQSLLTCLGHLGWHDINRNDPIRVALPKVAKASKAVAQNCPLVLLTNFANVNNPLGQFYLCCMAQGGQGKYSSVSLSLVLWR